MLLVFKILYYFFYSCYKKDFSKSWQDISSKISLRHLQNVFKTSWKTKNCTSWKTRNCFAEDVFKTFWIPKKVCCFPSWFFFCLKSKNLLFHFYFFLRWWFPSSYQGRGVCDRIPLLTPVVLAPCFLNSSKISALKVLFTNIFLQFYNTSWKWGVFDIFSWSNGCLELACLSPHTA